MAYNSAYTGPQVDAGIAKANSAVQPDGSVPMTGALDMGGERVTNVGAPTAGTDAVRQSDLAALSEEIDKIIDGTTPVTIPVATEIKAGVVKPGDGIEVTADGTLNNTVTLDDLGGVPNTRTINGKALSANVSLSAGDVGARPDSWTPSAADVGAVPTSRTVNGKALSANISLNASDVGARASTWTPTASEVGAATPAQVTAAKPLIRSATLSASGWSNNSQTVTVSGVVADTSAQVIYVSPANQASAKAWGSAGVFCSAQGENSLTFVCDSAPSENISVNISIQEAQ